VARILSLRLCACGLAPLVFLSAADPYRSRWLSVADRLVLTEPASIPFNWGEGVQQIGLMKVYERSRDPRYLEFMEAWAGRYTSQDVKDLLNIRDTQPGRTGYCGHWSPATAILYLHEARTNQPGLELARQVARYIRRDAERSPEGGLGHWLGSHQLWVDTLYMACPLLAGLGRLDQEPDYISDAANQLLVFARHLQDPRSGLFYHMWDWRTREHTPGLWGRGNGWVMMSLADTLETLEPSHPLRGKLVRLAAKTVAGLHKTQDASGLWRTVLDDSSSYPESSATSMICYGTLKLIRLKALPVEHRAMALRAWTAVNERYVDGGQVTGVSAGTVPKGPDYYRGLPSGSQTWGTGAYLMAGSEVDRLR
jgi:unsaturated rhamnogalacturonyl hydrolase